MDTGEQKRTPKQRKWLAAYLETGNGAEAARQAGYKGDDQQLAEIGYQNSRKLQIPIDELMEREGLSDVALMRKLHEGLDATLTVTATHEGLISDERTYVDFGMRHRYLDTAYKLKGKYPAKGVDITSGGQPVKVLIGIDPDEI